MIVKPLFSPNFGLLFHKTNSNKLLSNISFPNQSSIIYIYIYNQRPYAREYEILLYGAFYEKN